MSRTLVTHGDRRIVGWKQSRMRYDDREENKHPAMWQSGQAKFDVRLLNGRSPRDMLYKRRKNVVDKCLGKKAIRNASIKAIELITWSGKRMYVNKPKVTKERMTNTITITKIACDAFNSNDYLLLEMQKGNDETIGNDLLWEAEPRRNPPYGGSAGASGRRIYFRLPPNFAKVEWTLCYTVDPYGPSRMSRQSSILPHNCECVRKSGPIWRASKNLNQQKYLKEDSYAP